MQDNIKVMVAGHICLDITPEFPMELKGDFNHVFAPGKLINIEKAVIGTGGTVSNTGLAMDKLGLDVKLNGKVSDDEFGNIIKSKVGQNKSSSFKTVPGQSSSYTVVLSLPGVDRIFLHHAGTNDTFGAEDIDYETLPGCALFHFGYPTLMRKMYEDGGRQLREIFKKAKELGVVTSLDMTIPDPESDSGKADWNKILKRVLPYVDIFLPSIEEIAYMLDRKLFDERKDQAGSKDPVLVYTGVDCSGLSSKLLDLGTKIAAIKVGIKGFYLRTAGEVVLKTLAPSTKEIDRWTDKELWAASYKTDKFGAATGAGDATIAGFLTAFLRGLDPVESVKAANMLGWQNIRQVDTLSGIKDWETTLEMINDKNKERNPLMINDEGWKYCENKQVYFGPGNI